MTNEEWMKSEIVKLNKWNVGLSVAVGVLAVWVLVLTYA